MTTRDRKVQFATQADHPYVPSSKLRRVRGAWRFLGDLLLYRTTWRVTAHNLDRVPRTGATIALFNHVTNFDAIASCVSFRFRDPVPLAKRELLTNPFTSLIVRTWQAIPIRRGAIDRLALQRCLDVLRAGDLLLMAPEGTRNKNGLGHPKDGPALLAHVTGALILPIGVSGTEHFVDNVKHLRRTPITVNYGRPLRVKAGVTDAQYGQIMTEIMYQIAALLPPIMRGVYADLSATTTETLEYAD